MNAVSNLVKVSLAGYLHDLPLPDSILGWFKLSFTEYARLIPFFGSLGFAAYVGYRAFGPRRFNKTIKMDVDKVVDVADVEELGEKSCFCRCWQSKKFPYCDGSHNAYNKMTGDNLGPMVVKKKV